MKNISGSTGAKGPIAWMAGHSVAANFIMLACLIGGFFFLINMKQEVFPDFQIDNVTISVSYPGASPEEVESGIVMAIEEAVGDLDGVDEVKSVSKEGIGIVTVEALVDADFQKLTQEIQREVDRISTFPEDAEEPQVNVLSFKRRVLSVVIYGDVGNGVLHEIAEQFRDKILQDPGVTQVDLAGIRPLEISIEVPQENLRRYHLTLEEIARRLRNASVDLPGGGIKTSGGEILIRMKERRDFGREFGRLPVVITSDGSKVLLEQIAHVTDGYEDTDYYAAYNGKSAVMVNIFRVGPQTPIQVSKTVRHYLKDLNMRLPNGVRANILNDSSDIFSQRIDLLLRNSAIGLALVLICLALFLEVRLAFWVMMGIPISFLGSFLFLPTLGVTINMISLFAFIIALGIVVDDAIVVGENIYYYRQKGIPFLQAAVRGVREITVPVVFSILTNIATFMPLYFIPGVPGKIFRVIPLVVITVFLISLVESIFVLPAHLAHQKNRKQSGISGWLHGLQQNFSSIFSNWVENRYGSFINFILHHRYFTVTMALALLLVTLSYALSGRMGMELFPKTESDFARARLSMPYGTAFEKTEAVAKRLFMSARKVADESGREDELVQGIFTEIGKGGSNNAVMTVYLAPSEIRDKIMSTGDFTRSWRKMVGEVPGVESLFFESDAGGPGAGRAITVELNHRELAVLERASMQLADVLRGYPRVRDVDDGFLPGKQQLDFSVLPEGKSLGLSARDVARQVRNAFYGAEVLRQQRGRNEVKVMVRLPEDERISEYNINELILFTGLGKEVPIREIVSVKRGRAYTEINRRNGRRNVLVEADVTPRSRAGEILNDLKARVLPQLTHAYPGLRFSFEGRHAEMMKSLGSLKITFLLAILAIYAMIAIPFQSYSQPIIVMASIPFGIIGAIYGHLLMGFNLSLMSMFGIVALSGVVVNDSLVLISFANQLRRQGNDSAHAVIRAAGIQRFRPIVLTTLTTFGGLAPMIFETSRQARMLIPIALSLGFGILFATTITLILVPSLYLIVEDIQGIFARPIEAADIDNMVGYEEA